MKFVTYKIFLLLCRNCLFFNFFTKSSFFEQKKANPPSSECVSSEQFCFSKGTIADNGSDIS